MLSRYMDNEISARVKVYAVNRGDFLAFRFTIDLRNNGDFEKDFVINFKISGDPASGRSERTLQKSISHIPPGSTRMLDVVLGQGEDCRQVTVEELIVRSPARGYHRQVTLPSPTIWDLAISGFRPAPH
jgi:hypothetical protein